MALGVVTGLQHKSRRNNMYKHGILILILHLVMKKIIIMIDDALREVSVLDIGTC